MYWVIVGIWEEQGTLYTCGYLQMSHNTCMLSHRKAVCRPFQIGLRKGKLCSAHLTLLSGLQGKKWDEYLEYLSNHGLKGLKDFLDSSVSRVSRASHNTAEKTEP